MILNLANLNETHPRLSEPQADEFNRYGALGLERAGHASGVVIALSVERARSKGQVAWAIVPGEDSAQYDGARITEITAEGVALALAHQAQGWRITRRGQRGQHCDWLLERTAGAERQTLALEISGLADGTLAALLAEKLDQVSRCPIGDLRCAIVVGLRAPEAQICTCPGEAS